MLIDRIHHPALPGGAIEKKFSALGAVIEWVRLAAAIAALPSAAVPMRVQNLFPRASPRYPGKPLALGTSRVSTADSQPTYKSASKVIPLSKTAL